MDGTPERLWACVPTLSVGTSSVWRGGVASARRLKEADVNRAGQLKLPLRNVGPRRNARPGRQLAFRVMVIPSFLRLVP